MVDNTCQLRKRLTVYERMSLEDVDKTRHLIHGEFANFIKKKGGQKNPRIDVEFPSYGNHTILKVNFLSKNFKNSISTKP